MPRSHLEVLLDHLTDGRPPDAATAPLREWLAGSRRFRSFADAHRDKIRKKLRTARDTDARLDVTAELAVAAALLGDRRVDLAWEPRGSTAGGADFAVAFRGHAAFDLEVTRSRGGAGGVERQLVAKHRQLRAGVPNAILVMTGAPDRIPDLDGIDRDLRARALADDDEPFRRAGLAGARDFRSRHERLGGVFVWAGAPTGERSASLWLNRPARIGLPEPAARAVLDAMRAS